MSEKSDSIKIIARNRKARHDFHILLVVEAGLVLTGTEVKSLRDGKVAMSDSFAVLRDNGEIFLHNLDIPEYSHGNKMNHESKRKRKLLLHKSEITKLSHKLKEKGLTMVPLAIYFKNGWAKVEMGLAKGKRQFDKRDAMRKKDDRREIERAVRRADR